MEEEKETINNLSTILFNDAISFALRNKSDKPQILS